MAASRNFKLGIFALGALAAVVAVAVALGIRAMTPSTITYHTYFDESVQGLDIGSPVKYRGVRIGNVKSIAVAPDRKHVDVTLALVDRDAEQLGLAHGSPEVRTQLGVQGLTGLKFVEIDFFDPVRDPPPRLPFATAVRTIPAHPSLITGLAGDLESLSQRLPSLADRVGRTLDRFDRVLDDVHGERLVARLGDALDRAGAASSELRKLASHVDAAHLPDKVSAVLVQTDTAIDRVGDLVARVGGDRGLVASAHRAADSIGDLGRSTLGSTDDLARAVRELADAARAVRELAEDLDRDPDMLVKGRARSNRP
jgi:ABC-type transporter Mla subunit MlaD